MVFLESVRDPANLGAIIRSAAAFGVDRLVISRDCADVTNAKTIRASMGAVFYTAVDICDDLVSAIETYRSEGKRVFAAALDKTAVRLGDLDKKPGDAVIIGNEGHGLSDAVLSVATQKVYIPISERVESLNASVAAAILMWGIG